MPCWKTTCVCSLKQGPHNAWATLAGEDRFPGTLPCPLVCMQLQALLGSRSQVVEVQSTWHARSKTPCLSLLFSENVCWALT